MYIYTYVYVYMNICICIIHMYMYTYVYVYIYTYAGKQLASAFSGATGLGGWGAGGLRSLCGHFRALPLHQFSEPILAPFWGPQMLRNGHFWEWTDAPQESSTLIDKAKRESSKTMTFSSEKLVFARSKVTKFEEMCCKNVMESVKSSNRCKKVVAKGLRKGFWTENGARHRLAML